LIVNKNDKKDNYIISMFIDDEIYIRTSVMGAIWSK
jgi:hypothetical protein